jgi:hypothetical protein
MLIYFSFFTTKRKTIQTRYFFSIAHISINFVHDEQLLLIGKRISQQEKVFVPSMLTTLIHGRSNAIVIVVHDEDFVVSNVHYDATRLC